MRVAQLLESPEEIKAADWARENYTPFTPISGVWNPVAQLECVRMNLEAIVEKPEKQEEARKAVAC